MEVGSFDAAALESTMTKPEALDRGREVALAVATAAVAAALTASPALCVRGREVAEVA